MADFEPQPNVVPIPLPGGESNIVSSGGGSVMKGGAFSSPNFKTGLAGWNISAEGNAEFNDGTFRGTFIIGGTLITVSNIDDLQDAIDTLEVEGGGTVSLTPDTYTATASITLPSGVTLDGNGSTIDFGGGAFQVLIQGTDAYSTGTISINYGQTTLVGVGTTWTSAMVGQSILLGDYWYEITAFTDTTHIEIAYFDGNPFMGTNLSGDTYVIATTVDGVQIQNLTLQNASGTLFKFRYVNGMEMHAFNCINGSQGIDGDDSGTITYTDNSNVIDCAVGITYNNVPFAVFDLCGAFNITGGTAIDLTRVSNTAIGTISIQAVTGVALKFTNCYDIGLINYAFIGTTSHCIEFVSGNRDMNISEGYIDKCGGDGVKLTATSDTIQIFGNSLLNCTGYGLNIANANCDNNVVNGNTFTNNSAGNIQDLGTLTVITGNSPIALNTSTVNISGDQTVAGTKTFSADPLIPDEVYGSGWNGVLEPPTKNAVYDKIETLSGTTCTSLLLEPEFPWSSTTVAGFTLNTNTTMYVARVRVKFAITSTKLTTRWSSTTTDGTVDITLYAENGQSQIFAVTTASLTASDFLETTTISATIPAGIYYLAVNTNGTADLVGFGWSPNVTPTPFGATAGILSDVTSEPMYQGTLTISAGTPPATIDPTALTESTAMCCLLARLD